MPPYARARAAQLGLRVEVEISVPGANEIPPIVKELLRRSDIIGVATMGAIVKGETKHDEAIGFATVDRLQGLATEFGKPVGLGIIGPGVTWKQAQKRIKEYAERSVGAIPEVIAAIKKARGKSKPKKDTD